MKMPTIASNTGSIQNAEHKIAMLTVLSHNSFPMFVNFAIILHRYKVLDMLFGSSVHDPSLHMYSFIHWAFISLYAIVHVISFELNSRDFVVDGVYCIGLVLL